MEKKSKKNDLLFFLPTIFSKQTKRNQTTRKIHFLYIFNALMEKIEKRTTFCFLPTVFSKQTKQSEKCQIEIKKDE